MNVRASESMCEGVRVSERVSERVREGEDARCV